MMLQEEVLENFRKRYSHIHPLVVQRSMERAKDASDLFEILESVPKNPPFSWDSERHAWVRDFDVAARSQMKKMKSR